MVTGVAAAVLALVDGERDGSELVRASDVSRHDTLGALTRLEAGAGLDLSADSLEIAGLRLVSGALLLEGDGDAHGHLARLADNVANLERLRSSR